VRIVVSMRANGMKGADTLVPSLLQIVVVMVLGVVVALETAAAAAAIVVVLLVPVLRPLGIC